MVNHWETWERPSQEEIGAYIKSLDLDKDVEPNIVEEITAGVMHQMLGEDPSEFISNAYPNGAPEILQELLAVIPQLSGDALTRATKLGYMIQNNQNLLTEVLAAGGKEAVKELLKEKAQEAEEMVPSNGVGGDSHKGNWMASGITAPPRNLSKSDILSKLIKLLEWEAFQAKPTDEYLQDPDGNYYRYKTVEELSELPKLHYSESAVYDESDELLMMNFACGNLHYYEMEEQITKSTDLILMIDDSGSMCQSSKIEWVKALILALYEKVVAAKSSLYIILFEETISGAIKISTLKERDLFLRDFYGGHGGTTQIDWCLEEVVKCVKAKRLLGNNGVIYQLEGDQTAIFIINDGQDYIPASFEVGHLTHVVTLFQLNQNLAKVCQATGGIALYAANDLTDYRNISGLAYNADDYDELEELT